MRKVRRSFRPRGSSLSDYQLDGRLRRSYTRTGTTSYNKKDILTSFLRCLNISISIGSIIIFPCNLYSKGQEGIVFVMIYIFMSYILTRPVYIMETVMGQFSAVGSIDMFYMICPGFMGLGLTQFVSCFFIMSYYSAIVSYFLQYLVFSCYPKMPWTHCRPSWTNCINTTSHSKMADDKILSTEAFFRYEVLIENVVIDQGLNLPNVELLLAVSVCWIVVFILMFIGIRRLTIVNYVISSCILLILIFFLLTSLGRGGAMNGVHYFLRFDLKQFFDIDIWYSAVTLSFFTLGVAYGCLSTSASFETGQKNISSVTQWNILLEITISLLASVICYSLIGSFLYDKRIRKFKTVISKQSITMAMVSYPYAIENSWIPQVFGIIFFLLLILLGALNISSFLLVITSQTLDYFIHMSEKMAVSFGCLIGFALSIIYTTPEGFIILGIVDKFAEFLSLIIVALCEVIVVQIYGLRYFAWDYEFLTRQRMDKITFISLRVIAPVLLTILYIPVIKSIVMLAINHKTTSELVVGIWLFFFGLLPIPICMLLVYCCKCNCYEVFWSERWLPYNQESAYVKFKLNKIKDIDIDLDESKETWKQKFFKY